MTIKNKKSNNSGDTIKLESVQNSDCRFLYTLLKQRDSKINISHKRMPTYQEHIKFVLSKPYSKWYTIRLKNKKIGSIYLSRQSEIGIFLEKKSQKIGVGKQALLLLMKKNPRKRYLANVSPKNTKSIKFFEKNGFKLIQYTYELMPPKT